MRRRVQVFFNPNLFSVFTPSNESVFLQLFKSKTIVHILQKPRKNAIVDYLDYQIPVTYLDYSDTRYSAKGSARYPLLS